LENWRRPPGRPRTTWIKTIQQDLESFNLSLNELSNRLGSELSTLEIDVYVWRYALVVVHAKINELWLTPRCKKLWSFQPKKTRSATVMGGPVYSLRLLGMGCFRMLEVSRRVILDCRPAGFTVNGGRQACKGRGGAEAPAR